MSEISCQVSLTRTGRRGSGGEQGPDVSTALTKDALPVCPSPAPRTHKHTHTPAPVTVSSHGSRKMQGMEVRADGFQEKRVQGACVSDSPVSRCPVPWCSKVPLVVTAQGTAASLCRWRGVFASLLAGEGSQPRSYCQHGGGSLCLDAWGLTSPVTHSSPASEASGCSLGGQGHGPSWRSSRPGRGSLAGLFLICTCASETEEQTCASCCPSLFTLWEQPPLLERVTVPP